MADTSEQQPSVEEAPQAPPAFDGEPAVAAAAAAQHVEAPAAPEEPAAAVAEAADPPAGGEPPIDAQAAVAQAQAVAAKLLAQAGVSAALQFALQGSGSADAGARLAVGPQQPLVHTLVPHLYFQADQQAGLNGKRAREEEEDVGGPEKKRPSAGDLEGANGAGGAGEDPLVPGVRKSARVGRPRPPSVAAAVCGSPLTLAAVQGQPLQPLPPLAITPPLPHPQGPMEILDVQTALVGRLIGKAGETIRNLQLQTDTRIQVRLAPARMRLQSRRSSATGKPSGRRLCWGAGRRKPTAYG